MPHPRHFPQPMVPHGIEKPSPNAEPHAGQGGCLRRPALGLVFCSASQELTDSETETDCSKYTQNMLTA